MHVYTRGLITPGNRNGVRQCRCRAYDLAWSFSSEAAAAAARRGCESLRTFCDPSSRSGCTCISSTAYSKVRPARHLRLATCSTALLESELLAATRAPETQALLQATSVGFSFLCQIGRARGGCASSWAGRGVDAFHLVLPNGRALPGFHHLCKPFSPPSLLPGTVFCLRRIALAVGLWSGLLVPAAHVGGRYVVALVSLTSHSTVISGRVSNTRHDATSLSQCSFCSIGNVWSRFRGRRRVCFY